MNRLIDCMERRLLPDAVYRCGIQFLLKAKLHDKVFNDLLCFKHGQRAILLG